MSHTSVTDYLSTDLAGKYRRTESQAAQHIPPEVTEADLASVREKGYVVIEKLLTGSELEEIRQSASALLKQVSHTEA